MGGPPGGEHASALAVRSIRSHFRTRMAGNSNHSQRPMLSAAFRAANRAILDETIRHPELRSMGTTLVLLFLRKKSAYVAGLGDSRVYLVRKHSIRQLTHDHSLGQFLIDQGTIAPHEFSHVHKHHALLRHLGNNPCDPPEVRTLAIEAGDRFLLTSDGLTGAIRDAEILRVVASHRSPRSTANRLVQIALSNGSRDNVSCVVVHVDKVTSRH
jgi:protein phosphatase